MGAETRIGQLQSKQFKTMEEEKALREMGCDNGALLPPVGHVGPLSGAAYFSLYSCSK